MAHRPPLGVVRADPKEAATSGLWHINQARAWVCGPALRLSLEGDFDPTPLLEALQVAEAEATKLKQAMEGR